MRDPTLKLEKSSITDMFHGRRIKRIHHLYIESSRGEKSHQDPRSGTDGCAGMLAKLLLPSSELGLPPRAAKLLDALQWLEQNCATEPLSEDSIRRYHRMVSAAGHHKPGEYRTGRMEVERSKVARPPGSKVPALMKQLDGKLEAEQTSFDKAEVPDRAEVFRFAVGVHQRIVYIHPFEGANGRVARLAMNHLLRRYGHGYVILPALDKSPEHFNALERAHLGDQTELVELAKRHLYGA